MQNRIHVLICVVSDVYFGVWIQELFLCIFLLFYDIRLLYSFLISELIFLKSLNIITTH